MPAVALSPRSRLYDFDCVQDAFSGQSNHFTLSRRDTGYFGGHFRWNTSIKNQFCVESIRACNFDFDYVNILIYMII